MGRRKICRNARFWGPFLQPNPPSDRKVGSKCHRDPQISQFLFVSTFVKNTLSDCGEVWRKAVGNAGNGGGNGKRSPEGKRARNENSSKRTERSDFLPNECTQFELVHRKVLAKGCRLSLYRGFTELGTTFQTKKRLCNLSNTSLKKSLTPNTTDRSVGSLRSTPLVRSSYSKVLDFRRSSELPGKRTLTAGFR